MTTTLTSDGDLLGHHAVAVPALALRKRADPKFLRLTAALSATLASPNYPLVRVSRLLTERIAYGTSTRLTEEPSGLPVLRMSNITEDGWDTTELKYLDIDAPPEAWRLQHGDVVVNRTNSEELVGKAAVFDLGDAADTWLYASYLLRLRPDPLLAMPRFLVAFINSPAGRLQVDRVSRRAVGMANINTSEIGNLLVPLPRREEQERLLKPLSAAFTDRMSRVADARSVLTGTDEDFLDAVGVSPPVVRLDRSYATTARQASDANRLGAQFFHPERAVAMRAVLEATRAEARPLGQLAAFANERCSPDPSETYVGLSAVEPHTGELRLVGEEAADAKRYRRGDVLYARLRPYLNKVHYAENDGVCSTEFYVLRPADGVDGRFLAIAMRSSLALGQTRHMMTGNTHPRVVEADAKQLLLPIPRGDTQAAVAALFLERRSKALALRAAAEQGWVDAQRAFDAALLS